MKTEKSCGCIILKNNKILLIGARDNEGKLFWSFPKGHQEPGETDIETALRETKEEVGLDVKIIDTNPLVDGHLIGNTAVFKNVLLFISKPLNENIKVQEDEVERAKWMPIDKAGKYFNDYYRNAWEELLNRLHKPKLTQ